MKKPQKIAAVVLTLAMLVTVPFTAFAADEDAQDAATTSDAEGEDADSSESAEEASTDPVVLPKTYEVWDAEALKDALAAAEDGDIITVMDDVDAAELELEEGDFVAQSITLRGYSPMASNTIANAEIQVASGKTLKLKNININASGADENSLYYQVVSGDADATVVIEGEVSLTINDNTGNAAGVAPTAIAVGTLELLDGATLVATGGGAAAEVYSAEADANVDVTSPAGNGVTVDKLVLGANASVTGTGGNQVSSKTATEFVGGDGVYAKVVAAAEGASITGTGGNATVVRSPEVALVGGNGICIGEFEGEIPSDLSLVATGGNIVRNGDNAGDVSREAANAFEASQAGAGLVVETLEEGSYDWTGTVVGGEADSVRYVAIGTAAPGKASVVPSGVLFPNLAKDYSGAYNKHYTYSVVAEAEAEGKGVVVLTATSYVAENPVFQWQMQDEDGEWADIASARSSVYYVRGLEAGDDVTFRCVMQSKYSAVVYSEAVTVTVK